MPGTLNLGKLKETGECIEFTTKIKGHHYNKTEKCMKLNVFGDEVLVLMNNIYEHSTY